MPAQVPAAPPGSEGAAAEKVIQELEAKGAGNAETARVVAELQDWGFIGEVLMVDPTWIDVAYTWSWPGSSWKQQALAALVKSSLGISFDLLECPVFLEENA
jgi:hypothetical protein